MNLRRVLNIHSSAIKQRNLRAADFAYPLWVVGGFVGISGASAVHYLNLSFYRFTVSVQLNNVITTLLVALPVAVGGAIAGAGTLSKFDAAIAPQRRLAVVAGWALGGGIAAAIAYALFALAIFRPTEDIFDLTIDGFIGGFAGGLVGGAATLWALAPHLAAKGWQLVASWTVAFAVGGGLAMAAGTLPAMGTYDIFVAWVFCWGLSGSLGALVAAWIGLRGMSRILSETVPAAG